MTILARLDVAPELLGQLMAVLPGSIRIIGSEETNMNGVVRLVLDVTGTGERGGYWSAIWKIEGSVVTITFGP